MSRTDTASRVIAASAERVYPARVVQAVGFVSDDPAFTGTMTMAWSVAPTVDGVRVEVRADNVVRVDAAVQFAVEAGLAAGVDESADVRTGDYHLTGS